MPPKNPVNSKKRPDGKSLSCETCGLYKFPTTPKMEPYGNNQKGIMIIGEAPGEVEDNKGQPFVGKTGGLLRRYLKSMGVDIFEDCVCLNAVNCRPQGNRTPVNKEIDCCREVKVLEAIEQYNPKVIILLGGIALQSIIGHRWKKDFGGITKWRGFAIPDQDFKCWICPTFHPSYVSRMEDERADLIWENDLKQAITLVDVEFPRNEKPDIQFIDNLTPLSGITDDLIAFDLETTGLKPHGKGHRIICASVATSNKVYTFMIPPTKEKRALFLDLLTNKLIGKIAHNFKFEHAWCRERFGIEVQGWEFDTMLAAHIIDNRTGITSLKFQVYVNFGVVDYTSEISKYLAGDYKNANSHNKIQELCETEEGKMKLLEYCALDSFFEYRLAFRQIDIMDYSFLPF